MKAIDYSVLGFQPAPELRTLQEHRMIDQILQWGYPAEVRSGHEAMARAKALAHLNDWIGLGLGVGRSETGERLFDPVEVMNVFIAAGVRGEDGFWADRWVRGKRREICRFQPGANGDGAPPQVLNLPERRFSFNFQRTYSVAAAHGSATWRLRLPGPVQDGALADLSLDLDLPEGAKARVEPGRIDVRLQPDDRSTLALGFSARFIGRPSGVVDEALTASDRQAYLNPVEGFIRVSPRIAALARRLTSDDEGAERRVEKFCAYMVENFRCGMLYYHQIGADAPFDWTLDTGWFDCLTGVALLCSLCRAIEIPARMVSGYFLYPDNPTSHYWCEAWLSGRGWVPFDLGVWNLSLAGRDPAWLKVFQGGVDYRVKTQVLPHVFTGASTIAAGVKWRTVRRLIPGAVEATTDDIADGSTSYRDIVSVAEG